MSELRTPFAFVFDDFSAVATGSDGVEVGTWTVGTKELFFTQGGNRVLKVDVVNEAIHGSAWDGLTSAVATLANVPVWEMYGDTAFQVWMRSSEKYGTGMSVDDAGVVYGGDIGLRPGLSEADCLLA